MDIVVAATRKFSNKENNNPVLVPAHSEYLQKEGLFNRNNFNNRYQRKMTQPKISTQSSIPKSDSSKSLQKEMDRILTHIRLNGDQEFDKTLLRIQHMRPLTPTKKRTPTYCLPPLEYSDEQSQNKIRFRTYSKKIQTQPLINDFIRQKRTTSQVFEKLPQPFIKKTPMQQINMILENATQIAQICSEFKEMGEILHDDELLDLVSSDKFKMELMFLVQSNANLSQVDLQKLLKKFLIKQAQQYKELIEAENNHLYLKRNLTLTLSNYISELETRI